MDERFRMVTSLSRQNGRTQSNHPFGNNALRCLSRWWLRPVSRLATYFRIEQQSPLED